ncbi:rhomboid-related protein 4 isoform X2 [Carassius carassius]|uniref:rhomboid-related protein 4 isoform X2 n=1 Tax=Carassius carassius TaxID=217509 RepID=UPI002868466A|nr:rhomboid-related protein 4 isoform X2 [Carassius carassius]
MWLCILVANNPLYVFQMRNRHRGSNLGLLLLASQVFQLGIDNIPPVTLATLGLNVYLFLFPFKPLLQACLSVREAYWYRDWSRLLLSPFHHADDMHLYFNMASLLWKGIRLERKLGGAWFAYLLSVFSALTGLVYLLLEMGLTHMTEDSSYSLQCAVGFSGVLFGLKVVNNHYHPGGTTYILGLPVANRYTCWVELVLIHIMNPGTSFVGHLAGILVGLLYTTGPLKSLMKTFAGFVTSTGQYGGQQTYYNSSGYSGYGRPYPPNSQYGQQSFNRRHYGAPYRQQNDIPPSAPPQHPYTAGGFTQARSSHDTYVHSNPTLEEIRRLRLQRFNS